MLFALSLSLSLCVCLWFLHSLMWKFELGKGEDVLPHSSLQWWAPCKPGDYHKLNSVQLGSEWCSGLEGIVSVWSRQ